MKWGSLSSQIRGLNIILANGTLLELTGPKQNLHLWRALSVSVGRLGIITELKMRIKPQQSVRRRLQEMDIGEFAKQVKAVQDEYVAAKQAGDVAAQKRALFKLDETQVMWHVATQAVWRTDYDHLDREPAAVLLNIDKNDPTVAAMAGPNPSGAFAQVNRQPVAPNQPLTLNARYWGNFFATTMRGFVTPGYVCASAVCCLSFHPFFFAATPPTYRRSPLDSLF